MKWKNSLGIYVCVYVSACMYECARTFDVKGGLRMLTSATLPLVASVGYE